MDLKCTWVKQSNFYYYADKMEIRVDTKEIEIVEEYIYLGK